MCRCPTHSSSCEQGSAVRRTREVAAGTCGPCDGSRMGQVEPFRSHVVLVQKAAERHHEAKSRPENRWNWIVRRLLHDALSSISKRLGLQRVRCPVSVGKCLLLLVRSTGREMLDVRGRSTARKCLRRRVLWSQDWNKVFTTCMDHLRLSWTHVDDFLSAFKKAFQEIQGCFATSCAQASFETTVRLGCVLRNDHLQRWQSHQGDTSR